MTWHIIGILVFVVIYNIWRYYHEDDSDDYGPNIEPEPKNNEVNGSCMEETILMEAANDCMFVNLIWPWCHNFSKFDIDEFARVRQVVNEINVQGTVSVVYTLADSDDVAVHIKKHFLFISQIPQIEDYLKLILKNFFDIARRLELEIERLKMQECEK